jgi:hypothetical protein
VDTGPGTPFIAIDTAPGGDFTVPIWTGQSGIQRNLLNPTPKEISIIGIKIVVSFDHRLNKFASLKMAMIEYRNIGSVLHRIELYYDS